MTYDLGHGYWEVTFLTVKASGQESINGNDFYRVCNYEFFHLIKSLFMHNNIPANFFREIARGIFILGVPGFRR